MTLMLMILRLFGLAFYGIISRDCSRGVGAASQISPARGGGVRPLGRSYGWLGGGLDVLPPQEAE
jgi:hypothetical protein